LPISGSAAQADEATSVAKTNKVVSDVRLMATPGKPTDAWEGRDRAAQKALTL
jgi:hypothetical protein